MTIHTLLPQDQPSLDQYLKKIHDFPLLAQEEEYVLAKKWASDQDKKALDKLITSHMRLVSKVASGYRGYGLPIADLIAEGNVGMLQALKKFDPEKGYRFSTYALWWIKAAMQEYILKSWSLVKVGTTSAQKKLFFNLARIKRRLAQDNAVDNKSDNFSKQAAKELGVREQDVELMEKRLSGKDFSLNAIVNSDGGATEWIDWVACDRASSEDDIVMEVTHKKQVKALRACFNHLSPRELEVLKLRRLKEPPHTLDALSQKLSVSKERVRQIEVSAFNKLRKTMLKKTERHYAL